ncbi:MAG TPA: Calx-beta domain-containing protein [Gammaproteobacteria bacterium]
MNNKKPVIFSLLSALITTPAFALTLNVSSVTDDVDVNPGDGICATSGGACTLRAAVQEANASAGADTLTLAAGTYVLTRGAAGEDAGAEGDLDIKDHLIITGAGNASTIIDGNGADRVMDLGDGVRLELRDLTIQNGVVPPEFWYGGAVSMTKSNTLVMSGVHLSNNQALEGGAIYCINEGRIDINDSQLDGNHASSGDGSFGAGGAIHALQRCSISIANSVFSNNSGNTYGGAIQSEQGELLITGSQFIGNTTADDGGAINSFYGNQTVIVDSTFTGNTAAGSRGAISSVGPIKIFNSTFSSNTATYNYCGAFGLSDAYLDGVTVDGNIGGGGCLYNSKVVNSVFKNNTFDPSKQSLGGGISGSNVEIRDSAIINNNATTSGAYVGQGGGLYLSTQATVVNTTISGNSANDGGAIYVDAFNPGTYTFTNVTLANNNATVANKADNLASNALATMTLANSIVALATSGVNCTGQITTGGGNVASDATCSLGAQDSVADPLLQTLDTTTYVHPLAASSPAIDGGAASVTCPVADQRGYLRTDGSCDSGAYESGASAVAVKSVIAITESYTEMPEYGSAIFTLTRSGSTQGEVSVAITTVSDTARGTEDYTPLSQIVTWAAGDSAPKVIEVPLVTDQAVEGDEEFVLRIAAVSPNGTIDSLKQDGRVHIFDNDGNYGVITIDSAYSRWENHGALTIWVARLYGSDKDYSVDYRTVAGTAVDGVDFTGVSGTLHWSAGDAEPKPITIEISNDALVEGAEQFTLELFNHTRTMGDITDTATVTIEDDESWAVFDFSSSTYSVSEGAGKLAVTVVRSGKLNVEAKVNLSTDLTGGTATVNDAQAYSQQLVFAAGEVSKTVNIVINKDSEVESAETLPLYLWSPVNGKLGDVTNAVATITDGGSAPPPSSTSAAAPSSGGGGSLELAMLLLLLVFWFVMPAHSWARRG